MSTLATDARMAHTAELDPRSEVRTFVAAVRDQLEDLPVEDREDLTDGLAADLGDLVAERGLGVLHDPAGYAAELRAAAGLDDGSAPRGPRSRSVGAVVQDWLDGNRRHWLATVQRPALSGAWELVALLRPAWWVLRAWVALALLLMVTGRYEQIAVVPEPGESRALGLVLLLVAVLGSVQIGRGRWWPGRTADTRRVWTRLLLVGLNTLAVVALLPAVDSQTTISRADRLNLEYADYDVPGLTLDGRQVGNVFAYDADGSPLTGVQLFDERGRPLTLEGSTQQQYRTGDGAVTTYPYQNGTQQLWNVFPLPVREQPAPWRAGRRIEGAWTSDRPPALPQPPLLAVPPATLPTDKTRDETTDKARDERRGERRGEPSGRPGASADSPEGPGTSGTAQPRGRGRRTTSPGKPTAGSRDSEQQGGR